MSFETKISQEIISIQNWLNDLTENEKESEQIKQIQNIIEKIENEKDFSQNTFEILKSSHFFTTNITSFMFFIHMIF